MASSDLCAKCAFRLRILLLLLTVAAQGPRTAAAQSTVESDITSTPIRFEVETNSKNGLYALVPNRWTELHFQLENKGNEHRNLLCTSYFGDDTTLQFGRRVWLPAHSKLSLAHPIRLPSEDKFKDQSAEIHSLLIDDSRGGELLIKNESGQVRHDRSALITTTERNTGIFGGWKSEDLVPQDVVDLVVASRVSQGLNNKFTVLAGQFLPADETYLDYLDHLVIAENRLLDDSAAIAAVRRWLHAGGRLWIMLDRTDPALLERLLGDSVATHLIDRISLAGVKLEKGPSSTAGNKENTAKTTDYDAPVDMAQIVVQGMKVWNTVQDWPAALSCSVGEGRLLITTLGPRGWIEPTPKTGRHSNTLAPGFESAWVPNSPMEDIAAYLFSKRGAEVLATSDLEPIAREYISYKVPTWGTIVWSMSCFLASLLAAATCLYRWNCLEHFGWVGSVLAIGFGVFFTGIGISNRFGAPDILANVRLVQAISGTDDVRTHGVVTVYRPEGGPSLAKATSGGDLWPDVSGIEGTTRRLVSTDLGAFQWEGLPLTAGPRTYTDSTPGSYPKRIEAKATIDARGVVGQLVGHSVAATDAVLATRDGRIGVTFTPDGRFTALSENRFEADQYLDAKFLGDEQDRRRRILQHLFSSPTWKDYIDHPQLLVWANDWSSGLHFGEGLSPRGETLLSVPLELTQPKPGDELLIPSPLITFASRRPPDGVAPSGCWDDIKKEWQERSGASTTWLNFQIPRNLLPLKPNKARIQIEVSGPMHRLEILGVKNDVPASIGSISDPIGSLTFEVTDPEVLTVTNLGELCLGISVGDPSQAGATGQSTVKSGNSPANYWRIHSLNLQLWATASKRTNED